MAEVKRDQNQSFDSQEKVEAIATGEEQASEVNVESDYEASKQYNGGVSAEEAEAATAPKVKSANLPNSDNATTNAQSSGNPDSYRNMAKEVGQKS